MALQDSILRAATDADRPAVIDLTLDAYHQYTAQLGEHWWESYSQNVAVTLGAGAPGQLIVAEQHGTLIGSVIYLPQQVTPFGYPSLRLLAVTPAARGQGIASMLLEECLQRARTSGAERLVLHTNPVMEIPRRIYEKRGFIRAVEFDFYPVENELVLGYRIDLQPGALVQGLN